MTPLDAVNSLSAAEFAHATKDTRRPFVVRGLASHWPAVTAARQGDDAVSRYLMGFDAKQPLEAVIAPPTAGGRFFYNADLSGLNFNRQPVPLERFLEHLLMLRDKADAPTLYIQSTPTADALPGFARENAMPVLDAAVQPRIWIGNTTRVATHFDVADNMAVVVSGRRRFILFPPDQVGNLYVGPLDFTLAGQPVSLVDPLAPDFERFPKFAEALAQAFVAELEPGDAIYIPSPWWHHVEALEPFNILINFWWRDYPADSGTPFNLLIHGLLALRHLPAEERKAWRAMLDHYVFEDNGDPATHIPEHARSVLGPMTPDLASHLKRWLGTQLS